MLQIGNLDDQWVIDTRGLDISCLKEFFESKEITKLFHNAKFDIKFLRFTFGFIVENIYDTFLAECLLTNGRQNRKLSLGALALSYCNKSLNKDERGKFTSLNGIPYKESQIVYGAEDVQYLDMIRRQQLISIKEWRLENALNLENEVVSALADIEYNGMLLDSDMWAKLVEKEKVNVEGMLKSLNRTLVDKVPHSKFVNKALQTTMFDVDVKQTNINWDSPLQIKQLLKEMGIVLKSTTEKEIQVYQDSHPLIAEFIAYKKSTKLITTYGLSFLEHINRKTGRVHTSFWQILETGRVSSGDKIAPNMQNIPAKNDYRNCFRAKKGYKIVSCDFSGQEARIAAFGSQDDVWVDSFMNNKDLHSEVAVLVFKITLDIARDKPTFLKGKSYRDVAKTINFAILFGASKFKISKQLNISLDEAASIIDKYFKATPKLIAYLKACANYGLKRGYIRSYEPYSIVRWFDKWRPDLGSQDEDFKTMGEIERACFNTPVQATGAMMTKIAMVKIRDYIRTNKLEDVVKIVMVVHDQIDAEVREDFAEEWSDIQKRLMEEAGELIVKQIPIISEKTIGDCWQK